ncbi:MAG: phosphoenolpyruvate synthase, partial [Oscillospiraceae bacterium]|nr:phosphoenolpyruvate synthase [Oscillospiraceae bacterium]
MNIYDLSEHLDTEKTGNKAAFLSRMKRNGFNVPDGIVLGKDCFLETVSADENKEDADKLLGSLTKENAKETSEKIKELYSGLKLSDEIKTEIEKRTDPQKKYAVRSSGIKEDLEGFSFAGQYDTFINVSGTDDIADAVIKCYLSGYSETVLSYLASNGLASGGSEMAVIIEEMVNSEISGVAFTVNPMTGNDKEIIIEVTEGQGENLVSGKVAAESYGYDWWNKKITSSSGKLLSEVKIREISCTALKIQQFFGYPCDIEFAMENEELYILQARAITKIIYSGIKDQWTTADFKDGGVSATVCTPYMWSLYEYIWESEFRKFLI